MKKILRSQAKEKALSVMRGPKTLLLTAFFSIHIKNLGWFLLVRSVFSLSVHFHQGAFYLSILILLHHSCPG